MSEKANKESDDFIELRRRNLKAAALLKRWMIEDASDDQTDWPALEKDIQHSDLKFFEPELE